MRAKSVASSPVQHYARARARAFLFESYRRHQPLFLEPHTHTAMRIGGDELNAFPCFVSQRHFDFRCIGG